MKHLNILLKGCCGKGNLNPFILQVYCYSFFDELVFIYDLYAVMFAECGLSPLQISLLFVVWSVTGIILEIPSGALADRYSRRHILVFAQLVRMVGFGCWAVFPTFWGFALGFVCWGASGAFCSGTFEALVFDELKHFGKEDAYAKTIGRARSASLAGIIVASLGASLMIGLGYRFLIGMGLFSMLISCVPILMTRPVERVESTSETAYLSLLKEGIGEAVRNRAIRGLMLFSCFALMVGALDEYWPILAQKAGLSKPLIPLFMAAITIADALACAVAHRFEHFRDRHFYAAYSAAGGLLLIAAPLMRPLVVVPIAAFTFVLRVSGIVFESRIQHAIETKARATALSVNGFLTQTGAIGVNIGFGFTAGHFGYIAGFGAFAIAMVLIGVMLMQKMGRRAGGE